MSFRVYCDKAKTGLVCDVGQFGRKCEIETGSNFAVEVVASGPPVGGYSAFKVVVQYSGNVTLNPQPGFSEGKSPICEIPVELVTYNRYTFSCKKVPVFSRQLSNYNGALANVFFTCNGGPAQIDIIATTGGGSLYSKPGTVNPVSIFLNSQTKGNQQVADSVRINCEPVPLPSAFGDTDGDGCSDQREIGTNQLLGGRRNYLNRYDFYDVSGPGGKPDGVIDLSNDILSLAQRISSIGSPQYSAFFDRGPSTGPNAWNMTAPDGAIDLANDLLGAISQHGHRCN